MTPFEQQLSASIQAQLAAEGDLTRQDMFNVCTHPQHGVLQAYVYTQIVEFTHRDNSDLVEMVLDEKLSRNTV